MGTQIHAEDNYRRVVELIQSGAIGPVTEALVWCGKDWGGGTRPKDTPEVPKNIHWDQWIGPAAFRPYHPCYLPVNWRRWWDFGNGTLGDMACHIMDVVFWAWAATSDLDRGRRAAGRRRRLPTQADGSLRVSRARREAAGESDVV